jgi:hypothetical protein
VTIGLIGFDNTSDALCQVGSTDFAPVGAYKVTVSTDTWITHMELVQGGGNASYAGTVLLGVTDLLTRPSQQSYLGSVLLTLPGGNQGVSMRGALDRPVLLKAGKDYFFTGMIMTNAGNMSLHANPSASLPPKSADTATASDLAYYGGSIVATSWSGPIGSYRLFFRAYADGSTYTETLVGRVGNGNFGSGTAFGNWAAYTFTPTVDTYVTHIDAAFGGGGSDAQVAISLGLPSTPDDTSAWLDHIDVPSPGGTPVPQRLALPGGPLLLTAGVTYAMVFRHVAGTANLYGDPSPLAGVNASIVHGTYYASGGGSWAGELTGYSIGLAAYADGTGGAAPIPEGDASGTWTFAGAATGTAPPDGPGEGSGTGAWAFVGSATGDGPANHGTASGTWDLTGVAVGEAARVGTADGVLTYVGAAVGSRLSSGDATGGTMWVGEAVGAAGGIVAPPDRTLVALSEDRTLYAVEESRRLGVRP